MTVQVRAVWTRSLQLVADHLLTQSMRPAPQHFDAAHRNSESLSGESQGMQVVLEQDRLVAEVYTGVVVYYC